jgi:hypothetical protein
LLPQKKVRQGLVSCFCCTSGQNPIKNRKKSKSCVISNYSKKIIYLSAFQKEGAKEEEPNEPGKRALLSLKSKACQKIAQKFLFLQNFYALESCLIQ